MPELPEVESIRRQLGPALVGSRFLRAELFRQDMLKSPSRSSRSIGRARELLQGLRIASIERHGKALGLVTREGPCLQIHLGMSGQLLLASPSETTTARPSHVHAEWHLDHGSVLRYRDPRRFGSLKWWPDLVVMRTQWERLGPDALGIDAATVCEVLQSTARCVKAVLLDQRKLAGVGNIYADEALFVSGIHPQRRCNSLTSGDAARLAAALAEVLHRGVDARGSTLRDYRLPDGSQGRGTMWHGVYGRAGLDCPQCGLPIQAAKIGGRTSHFCANCQC